ncbi:MAG: hypothetical protein WC972_03010 [Trueperaceae bacterium]
MPPTLTREKTRDLTERVMFEDAPPDSGYLARLTATLSTGDEINRNGRYYPVSVLADAAQEANKAADRGELIGLLDHPDWFEGNKGSPAKTVVKWERVWMDGAALKGEGLLLDTANGRDLDAQRKAKVRLGLSTNGMAASCFVKATELDPNSESTDLVQVIESFELLTVDVVNDPASVGAAINREARAMRERKEHDMTAEERAKQLETQLAEETTAREAAEKAAKTAQEAQAKAEAALTHAERLHVVEAALAGRSVPEAVRTAMVAAANTAENLDAAKDAVKALAEAFAAGTGNGNNHIPEGNKPTTDALAEARQQIGVTA